MATARNFSHQREIEHKLRAAEVCGLLKHQVEYGCTAPGELEMILSTSEAAVCCSSASARSFRASASSLVCCTLTCGYGDRPQPQSCALDSESCSGALRSPCDLLWHVVS